MTARPQISVVVPLYNKRPFVAEAIASVTQQSFSDYEIIVIDDGSTDDGAGVVTALALPGLRLLRQENAGVAAARNRGLAAATADLVAFLDADDVWHRHHLHHLHGLARAYPAAGLFANGFEERHSVTSPGREIDNVEYRLIDDFIAEAGIGRAWVFTSAAMVRRDVALGVGGFPVGESRGEDLDLWLRIALAYPVAVSDYVGCIYRRVSGSLTATQQVLAPDIAMRRIGAFLATNGSFAPERRIGLEELYNRLAIAHATDCLAGGNVQAARAFLALAAETRRWRRRWRSLHWLARAPAWSSGILFKIQRQLHAARR